MVSILSGRKHSLYRSVGAAYSYSRLAVMPHVKLAGDASFGDLSECSSWEMAHQSVACGWLNSACMLYVEPSPVIKEDFCCEISFLCKIYSKSRNHPLKNHFRLVWEWGEQADSHCCSKEAALTAIKTRWSRIKAFLSPQKHSILMDILGEF